MSSHQGDESTKGDAPASTQPSDWREEAATERSAANAEHTPHSRPLQPQQPLPLEASGPASPSHPLAAAVSPHDSNQTIRLPVNFSASSQLSFDAWCAQQAGHPGGRSLLSTDDLTRVSRSSSLFSLDGGPDSAASSVRPSRATTATGTPRVSIERRASDNEQPQAPEEEERGEMQQKRVKRMPEVKIAIEPKLRRPLTLHSVVPCIFTSAIGGGIYG